MSEENNKPGSAVQNIIATLKNNPKAMYALIGAVAVIALAIALGGGGGEVQVKTAVTVGQNVVLENPNGGETQLTTAPGLVSVATSEEDEELKVCVAPGGTRAVVEEEQAVGVLPFVKVKVLDGSCQGKSGWVSKINVKVK